LTGKGGGGGAGGTVEGVVVLRAFTSDDGVSYISLGSSSIERDD